MRMLSFFRLALLALFFALAGCGDDPQPAAPCVGTVCDGTCADLGSDPNHCGGCGIACEADQVCDDGQCVVGCAQGHDVCAGACVNLDDDRTNCGRCGRICAGGQVCDAGSCVCPEGGTACEGSCVDTSTDAAHCGSCGNACADGMACVDGSCVADCPEGQSLCSGTCVDTASDAAHCGGCGLACDDGATCVDSACACPEGQEACGGSCVDTSTDLQHCGACDAACVVGENAVEGTCVEGFCLLECEPGTYDCNQDPADGCETHVDSDADHCSACGNACGTGERCEMGVCCGPEGLVCGGACVDPQSDVANCGACGESCEGVPGAGSVACEAGACTFTCAEGFADCNGDPADGCEVELASDARNCGACGEECGAYCSAGACVDVTLARSSLSTSCVLGSDGGIHCWGYNGEGQVGDGGFAHRPTPHQVPIGPAVALEVGPYHSCAISSEGTIQCWGANVSGELGAGNTTQPTAPATVMDGAMPLADVTGLALTGHQPAGLGTPPVSSTCALLASGRVTCWGSGADGRLGDGTTTDRLTPDFVLSQGATLENVIQIAAGHAHVCALLQDGTVRCWGANAQGQLGLGDQVDRDQAVAVPGLTGVDEIAAGGQRTCARSGGTVQCWGTNAQGQLGDGSQTSSAVPVPVSGLTDAAALHLAQNHAFVLRTDGTWAGWGMGWSGELHHGGAPGFILEPVPVVEPTASTPWAGLQSMLAGGHSYGCAVDADGRVHCWGNNQYGQLGDGNVGAQHSRSTAEPVLW